MEIDNRDEFNFVSTFFTSNNSPRSEHLIIGMTDFGHENTWKYIHSGKTVTYTDWKSGNPVSKGGNDCVYLHYSNKKMYNQWCASRSYTRRFMCEVPS